LVKIIVQITSGKDHVFYIDVNNLSPAERSFLNDAVFGGGADIADIMHNSKVYEFKLPGYYEKDDVEIVREALAKCTVREDPGRAGVA
jgi:hypothetical protein